jgi:hypothetical protein
MNESGIGGYAEERMREIGECSKSKIIEGKEEFERLKLLSEGGNIEAMNDYGVFLLRLSVLVDNSTESEKEEILREFGITEYYYGWVRENKNRALEYLKVAADCGNPAAQFNYAFSLLFLRLGTAEEKEEAASYYIRAAKQGFLAAYGTVASCYEVGVGGVKKNEEEAKKWRVERFKIHDRYEIEKRQMYAFGNVLGDLLGVDVSAKTILEHFAPLSERGDEYAKFKCEMASKKFINPRTAESIRLDAIRKANADLEGCRQGAVLE